MKRHFTALGLIFIFVVFSVFIHLKESSKTVLDIFTPTKIGIDLDGNKTIVSGESVCIDGIESFSLEPSDEFYNKFSKSLNLSKTDMISLGFLAQDFSQKTLNSQDITFKPSGKVTPECLFGTVKLNGIDYKDLLANSGFGLIDGKIVDEVKFKTNLANARKLNLVILNHHSGKYHTLECPYGSASHDKVIIPQKQLPKNSKPCKFCNKAKEKFHKKYNFKKDFDIVEIPNIPQPKLTISDGNIKLLFTDFTKQLKPNKSCETNVCKELIRTIDLSKESLDIAIYGYQEVPAITQALIRAKNRGVKIRLVYDRSFDTSKDYYKDNDKIIQLTTQSKSDRSESKTSSNMLMHNKFFIIDKQIVFTGSMNISQTGLSGYDVNDVLVINSKEVASVYTAEFEQMLSGKFHKQKGKLNQNNKFKVGNSEVEVYFSPQDKTGKRLVELLKGARKYIYIPTFLITHKGISDELISAKARGVDVRIIIDANSTGTRNSKHATLRQNGILLKTENYAGKLHSKSMVIDDEYLIIGSMNFSNSGENKNDENLIVLKNSTLAQAHKNFFLYLWTMIPNKYLKLNARAESPESIGSCSDGIDNNFNGLTDYQEVLCKSK
jgi:phosphatidylserine/phosphatidylglycerophosphate/cardiolipin synthase-like enzyme